MYKIPTDQLAWRYSHTTSGSLSDCPAIHILTVGKIGVPGEFNEIVVRLAVEQRDGWLAGSITAPGYTPKVGAGTQLDLMHTLGVLSTRPDRTVDVPSHRLPRWRARLLELGAPVPLVW